MRSAANALAQHLPEAVTFACFAFLNGALLVEPHRVGRALPAPFEGRFSARRGTYRIIYTIDDDRRRVTVLSIEHRSDVYHA